MQRNPQGQQSIQIRPRIIIHGGAGNIQRSTLPADQYEAYRSALLSIVSNTNEYMKKSPSAQTIPSEKLVTSSISSGYPSALEIATFAVQQLENNTLFNSGHGAVFTRDGLNQLEASVMVSRGFKKRAVGVMGLTHVRNPILLAKKMLEHGEDDLGPTTYPRSTLSSADVDVPSAQGHTQIYGEAAEELARQYGLDMVDPGYFFTQKRWDEHIRALEREKTGLGAATWDADGYLPQGTCGAVALDERGVICAATSTGGMTNKLTGRVGDTPVPGAGFWAEEWTENGDPTGRGILEQVKDSLLGQELSVMFSSPLRSFLADCLPTPYMHAPSQSSFLPLGMKVTTRCMGASGTGNGDSFLRVNAVRTVGAMARWKPETSAKALSEVVGPNGELQKSAGDRWGKTGEGEGGMIGIECAVVKDSTGQIIDVRSDILMDYNCGGMYRAWIDDKGAPVMSIWANGAADMI